MAETVQEDNTTPLFRPSCSACAFCDGLRDMDHQEKDGSLGMLRLEEEENQDGVEDAGNTRGIVKSR